MLKEYTLRGLNCPNCAAKIEASVKSLPDVSSAVCNAISATLTLEVSDGYSGAVTADVEKIVHKYEPDVEVVARERNKKPAEAGDGRKQIIQLTAGALLFAAALIYNGESIKIFLYLAAYAVLGYNVVFRAVGNIFRGQFFDENFLMSAATAGAFAIGEYPEAVAVMLFYQIGEYFQELAVRNSKKSIASLMDIRPDCAHLRTEDGGLRTVSPEAVSIGDIIVVKPGEKIPLDGIVVDGESTLDTKPLTGEALPRTAARGDTVLSGCVNQGGLLSVEVTKAFGDSTASKILELVENAGARKAAPEKFITAFSRYYTPAVTALAVLLSVVPPLFVGGDWAEWIHRGLVFLVISCPCALVISIPLSFFGGIGAASRNGILVKGGNYLEALNKLDIIVFDKTGTLTKGELEVTGIHAANGYSEEEVLRLAAHAEAFSSHPIAQAVLRAYGKTPGSVQDYREIPGHGVSALVDGISVMVGNDRLVDPGAGSARAGAYVQADGVYAGSIVVADEVKPDSRSAIQTLKSMGVRRAVMLTGDDTRTANEVGAALALDEVHARLLPGGKVEALERIDASKRAKGKLAFVGDGINDAPVLARADIGVAMGGLGSDAAIEAADIVLMTDEPSKLVTAVEIARATHRIVVQNIVFVLGVKLVVLLLGALAVANMWHAVFADVGVAMLAILNAMRIKA